MDASKENMTNKKAIVKILRYGKRLLELSRTHKYACAVAKSLSTRFSGFGIREEAFRLAEIALSSPETQPGDRCMESQSGVL